MIVSISPTTMLSGTIVPPASKSHTVRGLLFALAAQGVSVLKNPLSSDDSEAAIEAVRALGVTVSPQIEADGSASLRIESPGIFALHAQKLSIDTRSSGITTTFLLPLLGLGAAEKTEVIVNCSAQMRARPMAPILDALADLGLSVRSLGTIGSLPVALSGRLRSGSVTISDGKNSQPISALLMALPFCDGDSEITVFGLRERPYVEMTLRWLEVLGVTMPRWEREGETDQFFVRGGQTLAPFSRAVPGDFSSASYALAAGVMRGGTVRIEGLDFGDAQGDKALFEIVKKMGASIKTDATGATVMGGKTLFGAEIDCDAFPDMVPTLAAIATQAVGKTVLKNVAHARIKETDRLRSMAEGLTALGARVSERPDGLEIDGGFPLHGAKLSGCGDHRTVMALSLAALCADGKSTIDTAEAVAKTYPSFWDDFRKIGANFEELQKAKLANSAFNN